MTASKALDSLRETSAETVNAALRLEIKELRRKIAETAIKTVTNQRYEDFVAEVAGRKVEPPSWLSPVKSTRRKLVVPTAFLSDEHFDEMVDPKQINHVNAYSRTIAVRRLKAFFENTVKLAKHYYSGLDYPGIVLALGGDNVTGNIHEELRNTNEAYLADTIIYYVEPVAAGIRILADEFGKVYIPGVVGNHGRGTHKPIHKGRVRDNFDWLFYQILAREFRNDPRIVFAISDASDIQYRVFQTTFLLTHGDQFKGGSGIAGLLSPMMLGDARKRKRAQAIQQPYDYLMMGHWHQLMQARSVIVNGSLKGYDEYAFDMNFDYEPPQQAFFLTSQERRQIWGFTPINVTEASDPYSGVKRANASETTSKAF